MILTKGTASRIQDRSLFTLLFLLVGTLSLLPLARLLFEAVAPNGIPSLAAVSEVFGNPVTWRATVHSLEISLGGTLLATVIGLVVALVVGLG
ncbi:MAG TPA: hypothetical protein PKJ46_06690, partial [Methanoculleus sp.]|nr:hypothetical protein [Methanoculleus sp.]